jgi:hypothetical protein
LPTGWPCHEFPCVYVLKQFEHLILLFLLFLLLFNCLFMFFITAFTFLSLILFSYLLFSNCYSLPSVILRVHSL